MSVCVMARRWNEFVEMLKTVQNSRQPAAEKKQVEKPTHDDANDSFSPSYTTPGYHINPETSSHNHRSSEQPKKDQNSSVEADLKEKKKKVQLSRQRNPAQRNHQNNSQNQVARNANVSLHEAQETKSQTASNQKSSNNDGDKQKQSKEVGGKKSQKQSGKDNNSSGNPRITLTDQVKSVSSKTTSNRQPAESQTKSCTTQKLQKQEVWHCRQSTIRYVSIK